MPEMQGPQAGAPSRWRIDPRRVLIILGLAAIVVVALVKISGGREMLNALGRVSPGSVVLLFAVFWFGMGVRVWRWQVLLAATGQRVGLKSLTQLLLAGYFINTVLPARAGDVARIALVSTEHKIPAETATGSLVMERALDVLVILLGAASSAYLVMSGITTVTWLRPLYAVAMGLILAIVIALLAAPRLEGLLLGLWQARWYQKVLKLGFSFLAAMRGMATDWPRLLLALLQTVIIWSTEIGVSWTALGAVGVHLPLGKLMFVILTVDLVGAVPVLPGGVGQIEAAYLFLLWNVMGVAKESASAAILLGRSAGYWSIMIVGGIVTVLTGALKRLEKPEAGETRRDS